MESSSNQNNSNNDGGDKHQQLWGSAQNCKSNKLANVDNKPAATGEDQNCSSNKNLEEGNDLDLEVESLSREELIKLVRKQKQMATIIEMKAQKQLETAKKEEEESAKQAEEFSQRIVQLEQEKAEVHTDLRQKLDEIMEMHKEIEEKSAEVAEKAMQINSLLTQLNEHTSHQHQMPTTEQEMKIQLAKETWYDMLAFVPRHRLGQIIPMIGDRKFASIVQKFLHEYREIMIDDIEIVAPYEEDPSGYPRVRARQLRFKMAETQMPANIKNFDTFALSYFDQAVLTLMQKFQQNGLLDNVSLLFDKLPSKEIVQPVLCHILPLINGIVSIYVKDSAQLVDFYDAGNTKDIHELNIKMMEETRFFGTGYDPQNLQPNKIDLYCRWLYQTARSDGKPRVLQFGRVNTNSAPISLFIDRIKKDFLMAINPVSFFIRILLPKAFQQLEDICLDNEKTKERLLTKMEEATMQEKKWQGVMLLISRYPLASTKKWIVANEKEVLNLDFLKDMPIAG